jgi:hypothetical protein
MSSRYSSLAYEDTRFSESALREAIEMFRRKITEGKAAPLVYIYVDVEDARLVGQPPYEVCFLRLAVCHRGSQCWESRGCQTPISSAGRPPPIGCHRRRPTSGASTAHTRATARERPGRCLAYRCCHCPWHGLPVNMELSAYCQGHLAAPD